MKASVAIPILCLIALFGCSPPTHHQIAPSPKAIQENGAITKLVNLAATGKRTVVYFWAPWCSICKPGLSELKHLAQRGGNGFQVVSVVVDANKNAQATEKIVSQLPFTTLYDDGSITEVYKVTAIPTTVTLGSRGEIIPMVDPLDRLKKSLVEGPRGWNSAPGIRSLEDTW